MNNFYLIEDALRFLKVRFDGKMTHNIMQEERGAALRLLYQLKLAIQRREGPPPDTTEETTMTGLRVGTVQRKLQQNFDNTVARLGEINVRTVGGKDVRTNKQRTEDLAVARFQVARNALFSSAKQMENNEKTLISTIQQQKRSENRRKLREN